MKAKVLIPLLIVALLVAADNAHGPPYCSGIASRKTSTVARATQVAPGRAWPTAMPPQEATVEEIIDRILLGRNSKGLEQLKWMDPRAIAELIRLEHPQIVAIVLSFLDPDQAAAVLAEFPERVRTDVIMRNVFFALLPVTVFAAGWQTFTVADLDSSGITGGASREIEVGLNGGDYLGISVPRFTTTQDSVLASGRYGAMQINNGGVIDGGSMQTRPTSNAPTSWNRSPRWSSPTDQGPPPNSF